MLALGEMDGETDGEEVAPGLRASVVQPHEFAVLVEPPLKAVGL
mgnify:CR=1